MGLANAGLRELLGQDGVLDGAVGRLQLVDQGVEIAASGWRHQLRSEVPVLSLVLHEQKIEVSASGADGGLLAEQRRAVREERVVELQPVEGAC